MTSHPTNNGPILLATPQRPTPSVSSTSSQTIQVSPLSPQDQAFHPYKYEGYPGYCRYLASDNDGFLFRRFGELNVRVLLNLQHDIIIKDKELLDLDDQCRSSTSPFALSNSLADDKDLASQNPIKGRAALLQTLQTLLQNYNEHLVTYSALRDKESAQVHQVQNVKNWLDNRSSANPLDINSGPILDEERQYLDAGIDLICLSRPSTTPVARMLKHSSIGRWLLHKDVKEGQANDPETTYHSRKKTDLIANMIVVMLGLTMLYGPMWWLNFVIDDVKRLAIISAFVFIFAIGLCLVGSGRPFETLAATAGYAAVLMVFMQKQEESKGAIAAEKGP